MYIAVIADNIADRKQLERLLGRANDALCAETGTLYIDAFGDAESLMRTPMKYELFFVDITLTEDHGKTIVEQLRSVGAPGQITICQPEETPFSYQNVIDGLLSIRKPILVAPLHQMIREVHKAHLQASIPTVELRSDTETYYIPTENIIYAQCQNHVLTVHTTDNGTISLLGDIEDFYRWVSNYSEFFYAKKDTILNKNHVLSSTKREYKLSNGEIITLSLLDLFIK